MLFGVQISQGIEAIGKCQKCHSFSDTELPPENPEEEKRIRFEIDWLNQQSEPKERKLDLPVD